MSAVLESVMVAEGRTGRFLQTYTGKKFFPSDPRVGDFDIIDIAVALGNMNRFGGHCRPYTVAEHSYLVSYMVPYEFALDGLMHDAEEAYITDVISPVKWALGRDNSLFKLSASIRSKLAEQFGQYGLKWPEPKCVSDADIQILALEKEALHPRSDAWDIPFPKPEGITIECWGHEYAAEMFLQRFCELTGTPSRELFDSLYKYRAQDNMAFRNQHGEINAMEIPYEYEAS